MQTVEARLALDLDDLLTLVAERRQIRELVLVPLAGDQIGGLGAGLRYGRTPARHLEVEMAEMATLEVVDEVGG